MLQIVYFTGKDQFIELIESQKNENLFVTASPSKADTIRSSLKNTLLSDVVTISKFTSELAKHLWSDENLRPKIRKKADLLLIFGILKNKYLPELTFEDFKDAYGVFSDLRSFSLQYDVISQVLNEESENIRLAVEMFWKLLEITGDVDEHGAYAILAEELRVHEEIRFFKEKNIIFWGFQHLNGQQIDLLKALSIRYNVIVPFPSKLEKYLKRSDWISWLLDQATKVVHQKESREINLEAEVLAINSREIASALKSKLKNNSQVIIGVSKLTPTHTSLIPHSSINFKIPTSLVDVEIMQLYDEILNLKPKQTVHDLLEWLNLRKKKNDSFKMLKAVQLFEDACKQIEILTDDKIQCDLFLHKLIKEIASLNQPRNSYTSILNHEAQVDLLDLSMLDKIHGKSEIYFCIDERFQDLMSLTSKYSEDIQKFLSPIGPLKRSELDLLFKKWEIENVVDRFKVTFLMPSEILKHNLVWKKILGDIKFNNKSDSIERLELRKPASWNSTKRYSGHFSASRIQTYQDCPKKFYFSYVDKIFPDLKLEKDIDPKLRGTIVHKIIEDFIKIKNPSLVFDLSFTQKVLDLFLIQEKLKLSFEIYHQRLIQLHHRAQNGIEFLKSLESGLGTVINWEIEKIFELPERRIKGQIDCIGTIGSHLILLDFKSTKSASSTAKEIESFESLQLWIYAQASRRMFSGLGKIPIVLGYVVLDNPEESLILTDDEDLLGKIKNLKISRTKKIENLEDALAQSILHTDEVMKKVTEDDKFLINPRKNDVCHFCELKSICIKREEAV